MLFAHQHDHVSMSLGVVTAATHVRVCGNVWAFLTLAVFQIMPTNVCLSTHPQLFVCVTVLTCLDEMIMKTYLVMFVMNMFPGMMNIDLSRPIFDEILNLVIILCGSLLTLSGCFCFCTAGMTVVI